MSHVVKVAELQRIASDTRLTLEAKAILFYLATREPGYRLSIPDLVGLTAHAPRRKPGKDLVYDRLNELIEVGYLTRKLVRRGADYFVHIVPLSPVEGVGV